MASVAGYSSRVICSHNLGESLGLGAVGFVAAGTDDSGVQLRWGYRRWVVRMLGQRSVAGLAGDHHMFALLLLFDDVGMASLANIVAGEGNRTSRRFRNRCSAVVTILAKTFRNNGNAQDQEYRQQYNDHRRQPNEMFYVLEQVGTQRQALL